MNMKQIKQLKELIASSFLLGFKTSREGFNGECPVDDLAPSNIEDTRYQFDGDEDIMNRPNLKELTKQAVEKIYKEFIINENQT